MRLSVVLLSLALTTTACTVREPGPPDPGGRRIAVIAGPLADPFFAALKSGAEQAAADLRVQMDYLAPAATAEFGAELVRLLGNAVANGADGIALGDYFPEQQDPGIRAAVAAGRTVVLINSGESSWQAVGATGYVGQDEQRTGTLAGQRLAEAGARRVLCVNHVPGSPATTQRCAGLGTALRAAGGAVTELPLASAEATNPTATQQAISGALTADPALDGVFTLGSSFAEQALRAIGPERRVRVATTDLSTGVLESVRDGRILFAVDQQPYLQGYYGVLIAVQRLAHGLRPNAPVRTGPLVVDQANAAEVLAHNRDRGIRGAK
ncbi:substrate-binding domain-containing protein [Crossiella cryophila]|uniref:Simple sugar transport system substrate-binding protein n=1 Tax=Crossiella cryophila TaxID=43355 RepID=A0A7W7CF40_9PSEU|nr:substrate-binding domain-containing protein [Crossiella cryophila]MBB4680021.1 simple sugar transport system substrate-binding protein [Crossiella cryophila]